MLVRKANRENAGMTASSEAILLWSIMHVLAFFEGD